MIGGIVVLAPPCPCGANTHLVDRPDVLARKRVGFRRAIGCPEHHEGGWRPASWSSPPRWPFRWPRGRR
jgi:hypothetical protein